MTISLQEAKYANQKLYSDVIPFEIIRKISDKTIEVREMDVKRHPDARCFEQNWIITSNPDNEVIRIRKNKHNQWRSQGKARFSLAVEPSHYYDYGF